MPFDTNEMSNLRGEKKCEGSKKFPRTKSKCEPCEKKEEEGEHVPTYCVIFCFRVRLN